MNTQATILFHLINCCGSERQWTFLLNKISTRIRLKEPQKNNKSASKYLEERGSLFHTYIYPRKKLKIS